MRPINKRKLVAGLVSAAGAAVLALGSLTAGASAAPNPGPPTGSNPDGPQSANVPYVAWVGEHVRLVICDPSINTRDVIGDSTKKSNQVIESNPFQFVNFSVEDWSGYQFQVPTPDGESGNNIGQIFDPGPAAFFESSEGKGCVATDYKSLNPGLSRIRAVIRNEETGEIVFSHQFLVIWLTANKPVLHEAGTEASGTEVFQGELNGSGAGNLAHFLGDPAGDGKFIPSPFSDPSAGEDKGLVQIRVTGSFPVVKESPLSNILANPSYTLPTDWVTLAETLASSSEETEPPGTNPALWDIHGTPGQVNGEEETAVDFSGNPNDVCTTGSEGPFSSTDNCNGKAGENPLFSKFSRVFGDLTSGLQATVGPYDPQSANETLLSDGRLNTDDAPMPSMRIDISIAGNKGGTDLGGVGQIEEASKAKIYSHDFTGETTAHNLYNPYYGAYIPATDRGLPESSGVTGPSPGGDFPGFLNKHPDPYVFWTPLLPTNQRYSHSTECLRRIGGQPEEYVTPSGPRTETFYTDERGEAYVTYTPGDGFFLENLPEVEKAGENEEGKILKNADGGCDLKNLFDKTIGESAISARAVYPYEPVDYPAQASENTLTKTVVSKWEKEWFEFPKGPGPSEQDIRIIVAKAQDIDGAPFIGEIVCFHAEQNSGVLAFTGSIVDTGDQLGFGVGRINLGGTSVVHPVGHEGQFCETTNSDGLAAIEVTNSTDPEVDLTVEYTEEGIVRDHHISFTAPIEESKEEEKGTVGGVKPPVEGASQTPPPSTPGSSPTSSSTTSSTSSGTTSSGTTTTPLVTPLVTAPVTGGGTTIKPLTKAQKLAAALKACKKLSKKKRAACEAKAKSAYSAKKKKK